MLIRKAKLKDLDVLTKLSFDLLKYHHRLDKYFSPSKDAKIFLRSFLKKCIYSKKYYLVVATQNEEIAGYGLAGLFSRSPIFKERKMGFIYDMYVIDKHRRKGINKMLLLEIYNWFQNHGIKNVELSVHSMNDIGNVVWEREKFRTMNVRKHKTI